MASMAPRNIDHFTLVPPPAIQEAPVVTAERGDGDPALSEMMSSLDCELGSDGLLMLWHEDDQVPRALFASGACHEQSDNERDMITAASAAVEADSHILPPHWIFAGERTRGAMLTARIAVSTGTAVIVASFLRTSDALRFRTSAASTRLLPIVRAFLQMWADSEGTARHLRAATAALDYSDVATILLDKRGSVTFVNAAARDMFARKDGLRKTGKMLSATRLADTLRLQAAIEHVINVDGDNHDAGSTLVVALHRTHGRPLLAAIASVPTAVGTGPTAIVTVYDPSRSTDEMLVPACKMYGLTHVETKLACLMATGASLVECAAKMRLQEQTARSYVKQLFSKTDTNRQGELVALLLSSAVRLAPGFKTSLI